MAELIVSQPPSVNSTFGVLFIGFILSVTLYGLTFFQTYVFFSRFPNERVWVKALVAMLCVIDTVTTALISHMQYVYLISSFLLTWTTLPVTKTFVAERGLATVAIFVVQYYYAMRLYQVTGRNRYISGAVAALASLSLGFGFASCAQLSHRGLISDLVTPSLKTAITLNEAAATACDCLILVALFCRLREARHQDLHRSGDWFERAMVNFVNRGPCFTLWQIVLLFTFVAQPRGQLWILWRFVISKCYINSLLSMLNSRKASRGRGVNEGDHVIADRPKNTQPMPSARDVCVNTLDLGQHGQTLSIELGPVSSRSDMGTVDLRARSSMDSGTLKNPLTPMSGKALSFTTT